LWREEGDGGVGKRWRGLENEMGKLKTGRIDKTETNFRYRFHHKELFQSP